MSLSPASARRPGPLTIVAVLALLLGLQPVTTDLYLPALPGLAAELGAPMAAAQLTLSALMLAFGFGQLLLGPVADLLGRRPVLVGGLTLYAFASAACTAAGSIDVLILLRVLQGVGMAAVVVCARAMVRDFFEPHEGAGVMSKALSGLGVIALSSPVVGGLLAAAFGWRAALALTGVYAALTLAVVMAAMPESIPLRNRHALHPRQMLTTWWRIGGHRTFQAWALLASATYGGLYAYLAGSSFVFIDVLHLPRSTYGLILGSTSISYLTGTVFCRRWLPRYGLTGAVKRGAAFTFIGGAALGVLALAGVSSPWAIAVPQLFYAFGHGIHQPCGQAAVAGPFPANAGAASALAGFTLAVVAFVVGAWLGVAMDGTVVPLMLTQATMAMATVVVALTLVQRHGVPPPAVVVA